MTSHQWYDAWNPKCTLEKKFHNVQMRSTDMGINSIGIQATTAGELEYQKTLISGIFGPAIWLVLLVLLTGLAHGQYDTEIKVIRLIYLSTPWAALTHPPPPPPPPGQNGCHFRRRHFQVHFHEWKVLYFINITLKFVPKSPIDHN